MIDLMKRFLGFISAFSLYLSLVPLSFAEINIGLKDPANVSDKASQLIPFIIDLLFGIGLILALIYLLWGGIRWILTRGDKTKIEEARNHIVAAIVGLIFVVGAFVITNLVTQLLLGKNLSDSFKFPTLSSPGGNDDFLKNK